MSGAPDGDLTRRWLTGGDGPRADTGVHLLFLDESGQLSERRFFALGGVALRDRDWPALRDLWQATLAEQSWPADREVKWHGIRTGEVPPGLADAIVGALARSPVRCYVTLLDLELGATPRRLSSSRVTRTPTRPG